MNRSQKVLLLLTSAAVIPVLMASGVQTGKKAEEAVKQDETIASIASYLKEQSPDIPDEMARDIASFVYVESKSHEVDYRLVLAVMKVESNFRLDAVSPKGARGLLQIKPSVARDITDTLGEAWHGDGSLHEPQKNIRLGVYHLSTLIDKFETLPWALYAYNSGSTRARKLASTQKTPGLRFAKAVWTEYEKTMTVLPNAAVE
ncbi:MAG: soluble lytic murein transglycosylase [Deltaproteobacteria bacterium]|jgi:soluble lytic murein transglycosylase|nr:soluble lytic murein transglycosylase [Deltaproteobacteria bacterium]